MSVGAIRVCVDFRGPQGTTRSLDNVNFLAPPGQMTAIMGPSGCGKTTFLNVLSNRKSKNSIALGEVYFGGKEGLVEHVQEFSAYVMQEDDFLERLTVRETLSFACALKLKQASKDERKKTVERLLEELNLVGCGDVIVGGLTIKGISGGQRKRLSIAVALLGQPKILFLDEPTSGLDAALAFDVVESLSGLAHIHGHTVVCTVHQPRSEVYARFDRLLLLRAGAVVYHGPCADAVQYFASHSYVCPEDYNPADFFLDLLTVAQEDSSHAIKVAGQGEAEEAADAPEEASGQKKQVGGKAAAVDEGRFTISAEDADALVAAFAESEMLRKTVAEVQALPVEDLGMTDAGLRAKSGNFVSETLVLIHRGFIDSSRHPGFVYINTLQSLIMGLIMGSIWFHVEMPDTSSNECDVTTLRNALAPMMQFMVFISVSCFDSAVQQIMRRPLINRECAGGLYSRNAALIANNISDAPFHYTPVLLLAIILYWVYSFKHDAGVFFKWLLAAIVMKFCYWGFSLTVGVASPNMTVAMGSIPLTNVLFMLMSGYQLQDADIPEGYIWAKVIAPIRYAFQAVARDQLDDAYLNECFGFSTRDGFWPNIGILVIIAVVIRIVALAINPYLHANQGVQV